MDIAHLISAGFWESPGNFVAGEWLGELPELGKSGASVIFRTSGSTGSVKCIVLEKTALRYSARAVNKRLNVSDKSNWGLALPTDHIGGFAILARVFEARCSLDQLVGKWDVEKFSEWISEKQITHTSLVPTQLHDLVVASLKPAGCLKAVVIGGGKLSDELGQAARDLGWPVLASYGMTEAGSQIATQRIESLNRPFSDSSMEVLPIWKLETDAQDQLSISGEALFCGILIGEGDFAKFVPRASGAFLTNDRVLIDGNGITPLGRFDSLVKVKGILVDIDEIEKRFLEISGKRIERNKFAVLPLRDSRNEHILAAVFEGEIERDYLEEYHRQAAGLARISHAFSVVEFPRSSLGKLQRARLTELCEALKNDV